MRVAYYSPLPPERSGIADYSALLLPALSRLVDVEVVRRGRTRPVAADAAVYHVGNDPEAHGWIVDALRRRPGVVVLHDFVLHHLVAGLTLGRKDGRRTSRRWNEMRVSPAACSRTACSTAAFRRRGRRSPTRFRSSGRCSQTRRVDRSFALRGGAGASGRLPRTAVAHPAPGLADSCRRAGRERRPAPLRCFGHLNASKRIPQLVEAFDAVRARHPRARLLLVGPASPGFDADRFAAEGVDRIDYVGEERLWSLMAACDACISLRAPTMGETSGSAIRALSLGRPLVVSDLGWFAELPDDVALKVPVDDDEVPALTTALELLAASEVMQRAMGDAAREYVAREHDLHRVAEGYASALEESAAAPQSGTQSSPTSREPRRRSASSPVRRSPRSSAAGSTSSGWRATDGRIQARSRHQPARACSGLGVARRARRALRRFPLRTLAPCCRALDHGRRAHLFRAGEELRVHGPLPHPRRASRTYGVVYPLVIAPAWRLFASVPDAYGAAKTVGSVLMSLAAIPTYFLARRVTRPFLALVAAVLAVAVPSMMYTGTLMTETVFYPVFVCVALALVLALDRRPCRASSPCSACAWWLLSPARRPWCCFPPSRAHRWCWCGSTGGGCARCWTSASCTAASRRRARGPDGSARSRSLRRTTCSAATALPVTPTIAQARS